MPLVGYLHNERDRHLVIAPSVAGFDLDNVQTLIRDDTGQILEDPLAIVDECSELRLVRRAFLGSPPYFDPTLGIVHQVLHIGARLGMHAHALAARHIADDRLARNGIATARPINQHVIDSADFERTIALQGQASV